MAMTLDGELQRRTGVGVGMAKMMQDGSVEGVVKAVKRARTWRAETSRTKNDTAVPVGDGGEKMCQRRHEQRESQKTSILARVTAGQEGLYVVWKQDETATNYTTVASVEWTGGAAEGRAAVVRVAERHSALRTRSFMQRGKTVLQEVGWSAEREMEWEWSEVASRDEAAAVRGSVGGRTWQLESGEKGGVVRVSGVRWGGGGGGGVEGEGMKEARATIDVWMHHIVSDEWSMSVIVRELGDRRRGEREQCQAVGQMWEFAEWEWEVVERERRRDEGVVARAFARK